MPRRVLSSLSCAGLAALAACNALTDTSFSGTPVAVVVLDTRVKGAAFTTSPTVSFYKAQNITFSSTTAATDSCQLLSYSPTPSSGDGSAEVIGGGAFVLVQLSGRTDSLKKTTAGEQTYRLPGRLRRRQAGRTLHPRAARRAAHEPEHDGEWERGDRRERGDAPLVPLPRGLRHRTQPAAALRLPRRWHGQRAGRADCQMGGLRRSRRLRGAAAHRDRTRAKRDRRVHQPGFDLPPPAAGPALAGDERRTAGGGRRAAGRGPGRRKGRRRTGGGPGREATPPGGAGSP